MDHIEKIKIFYSSSTKNDLVNSFAEKIEEKLRNNDKCIVLNIDYNSGANELLNLVKKNIKDCNIFLCDITADTNNNSNLYIPIHNANVMLELGYAIHTKTLDSIMIIMNKSITKEKPSLLNGLYYDEYENTDDYIEIIYEKLEKLIKYKYENNNIFEPIEYELGQNFYKALDPILKLKYKDYQIYKNKKTNKIFIYIDAHLGYPRYIDVASKTLTVYNNKKEDIIDLSCIKEIYDDLKHLEIVALTNWLK
jgi:hypothetical protein